MKMKSGFTCPTFGMQLGFENYYGVSIIPTEEYDTQERLIYKHACVMVYQEVNGKIENRFNKLVRKMEYSPTYDEIEGKVFLNVTPEMFTLILYHVSIIEETFN